jgi:doublecortin-like kinase 1/2
VHECIHKTTRIQFALKIIDKSKCKGKEAMIASEVAILRKVKHQNIIQLIEDFDYTNELYLVMELVKV